MTKEQIQESSAKKVKAIETLCRQLQITISAEQMINDRGFIKQVVFYTDAEKYNVDKEPITTKKDESKKDKA